MFVVVAVLLAHRRLQLLVDPRLQIVRLAQVLVQLARVVQILAALVCQRFQLSELKVQALLHCLRAHKTVLKAFIDISTRNILFPREQQAHLRLQLVLRRTELLLLGRRVAVVAQVIARVLQIRKPRAVNASCSLTKALLRHLLIRNEPIQSHCTNKHFVEERQ